LKVRSCRVSMNGRAVVAEINGLPYCALSASVILPMRHVLSSYPSHPRERKPLWSQSDLPKGPHHTEVSTSRVTMVTGDTLLASKTCVPGSRMAAVGCRTLGYDGLSPPI